MWRQGIKVNFLKFKGMSRQDNKVNYLEFKEM